MIKLMIIIEILLFFASIIFVIAAIYLASYASKTMDKIKKYVLAMLSISMTVLAFFSISAFLDVLELFFRW